MNEEHKVRETLSALVDDELSELELQRVLKQPLSEEALAAMRRYQAVHAVLAGQGAVAGLDVRSRVAAALEGESPLAVSGDAAERQSAPGQTSSVPSRRQLFGGVAVAASVALAVIFSAQLVQEQPLATVPEVAQATTPAPTALVAGSQANVGGSVDDTSVDGVIGGNDVVPVAEQIMSEEHLRRLNSYLMRHAEHAALSNGQTTVPFARLVGHETTPPPQR